MDGRVVFGARRLEFILIARRFDDDLALGRDQTIPDGRFPAVVVGVVVVAGLREPAPTVASSPASSTSSKSPSPTEASSSSTPSQRSGQERVPHGRRRVALPVGHAPAASADARRLDPGGLARRRPDSRPIGARLDEKPIRLGPATRDRPGVQSASRRGGFRRRCGGDAGRLGGVHRPRPASADARAVHCTVGGGVRGGAVRSGGHDGGGR
mmetsp:Transcript_30999/g.92916  ORF Transcript_30999/g.92916 Transcript_30999/m.92916 type:complete len:211 (+) Transcript_30999:2025-2657(+)